MSSTIRWPASCQTSKHRWGAGSSDTGLSGLVRDPREAPQRSATACPGGPPPSTPARRWAEREPCRDQRGCRLVEAARPDIGERKRKAHHHQRNAPPGGRGLRYLLTTGGLAARANERQRPHSPAQKNLGRCDPLQHAADYIASWMPIPAAPCVWNPEARTLRLQSLK